MIKLPSEELNSLIDAVLHKCSITQDQLGAKCGVGRHTVTRWRKTGRIQKAHHSELLRLSRELVGVSTEPINLPIKLPFHVTIPRSALRVEVDANGNIVISGVLLAKLQKENL